MNAALMLLVLHVGPTLGFGDCMREAHEEGYRGRDAIVQAWCLCYGTCPTTRAAIPAEVDPPTDPPPPLSWPPGHGVIPGRGWIHGWPHRH